ncbi:hypothetical protein J7T55_004560 [Diaporthe amygdali]|uniref:uncharacterized protein n=1 Tax=Phomopsis amygdali TaxID=1214568 RepID=UPI0022FDC49F|nr:uncharacterized protein J7T55_004560 [Diaporthe amygdali]KAJ0114818.1 hypothetical protein J7T55_004560 [Diaporthe amygdali]
MHAARVSEIPVINSGREPERSLDGTVMCTGHQMEDNFEANLAAATSRLDEVCVSQLGLYTGFDNPATGTEGDTMVYACAYGSVSACDSVRFWELNPLFDEKCPGQGAWLYNLTTSMSYGRDPAGTTECYV